MKSSKLPTELAKNASKLHKKVGLLLEDNRLYKNMIIRQEYPVSKINPNFKSNREKFDWVIICLKVVIEVHGEQHYTPVCFGGMTKDEAKRNLKKRKEKDNEKKLAAEEAGWAYIVIKYNEKQITERELSLRITDALDEIEEIPKITDTRVKVKIQSRGFQKDGRKKKIQSRGFQKPSGGYKWPKRSLNTK